MGRLAIVLGSNATGPGGERVAAAAEAAGDAQVLKRHSEGPEFLLPHRVDHAANLRSLLERGCDRVLAIGSVGALRREIAVGEIVCPDDFIALHLGLTTREGPDAHATAGFDPDWRGRVLEAAGAAGPVRGSGVYWQTIGPRFETPAEIRLMAAHAHLVGMTVAAECIVAGELGLPYAALCVVDNQANGVGDRELSVAELEEFRAANAERVAALLESIAPVL